MTVKVKKKYLLDAIDGLGYIGRQTIKKNKTLYAYTFEELLSIYRYDGYKASALRLWRKACELQEEAEHQQAISACIKKIETQLYKLKQLTNETSTSN